jgi:hypothetical protein
MSQDLNTSNYLKKNFDFFTLKNEYEEALDKLEGKKKRSRSKSKSPLRKNKKIERDRSINKSLGVISTSNSKFNFFQVLFKYFPKEKITSLFSLLENEQDKIKLFKEIGEFRNEIHCEYKNKLLELLLFFIFSTRLWSEENEKKITCSSPTTADNINLINENLHLNNSHQVNSVNKTSSSSFTEILKNQICSFAILGNKKIVNNANNANMEIDEIQTETSCSEKRNSSSEEEKLQDINVPIKSSKDFPIQIKPVEKAKKNLSTSTSASKDSSPVRNSAAISGMNSPNNHSNNKNFQSQNAIMNHSLHSSTQQGAHPYQGEMPFMPFNPYMNPMFFGGMTNNMAYSMMNGMNGFYPHMNATNPHHPGALFNQMSQMSQMNQMMMNPYLMMSSMAGGFNPSSMEDYSNMINMNNLNNHNSASSDNRSKSPQTSTRHINLNSSQSPNSIKKNNTNNSHHPAVSNHNPYFMPGVSPTASNTSFLGNKTRRDDASSLSMMLPKNQQRNIFDDSDIIESSGKRKSIQKLSQSNIDTDHHTFSKKLNTKILASTDERKCLEETSKKSFAQKLNEMQIKLNSDEEEEKQINNINSTTGSKFLSLIKPHSNIHSNQSFHSFNPKDFNNISIQSTDALEESIVQGIIKLFSENFTEETLLKLKGLVSLPEETIKMLRLFLIEKSFPKVRKEYIFLFKKENESSGLFLKIDSMKKKYSLIKKKVSF